VNQTGRIAKTNARVASQDRFTPVMGIPGVLTSPSAPSDRAITSTAGFSPRGALGIGLFHQCSDQSHQLLMLGTFALIEEISDLDSSYVPS
jgi:hypothetical protein